MNQNSKMKRRKRKVMNYINFRSRNDYKPVKVRNLKSIRISVTCDIDFHLDSTPLAAVIS